MRAVQLIFGLQGKARKNPLCTPAKQQQNVASAPTCQTVTLWQVWQVGKSTSVCWNPISSILTPSDMYISVKVQSETQSMIESLIAPMKNCQGVLRSTARTYCTPGECLAKSPSAMDRRYTPSREENLIRTLTP